MNLLSARVFAVMLMSVVGTPAWTQHQNTDQDSRLGIEMVRQVLWSEYLTKKCPGQFRFRKEYSETRASALSLAKVIFETQNLRPVIQKTGSELMIGGCNNVTNFIRRSPERYEYIHRAVLR